MVKQTITYSDGTETVINYRGKVVEGEVILDTVPEPVEEPKEEEFELPAEETVETPAEESVETK